MEEERQKPTINKYALTALVVVYTVIVAWYLFIVAVVPTYRFYVLGISLDYDNSMIMTDEQMKKHSTPEHYESWKKAHSEKGI